MENKQEEGGGGTAATAAALSKGKRSSRLNFKGHRSLRKQVSVSLEWCIVEPTYLLATDVKEAVDRIRYRPNNNDRSLVIENGINEIFSDREVDFLHSQSIFKSIFPAPPILTGKASIQDKRRDIIALLSSVFL